MEEKYKLTKEEREIIKKIGMLGIRARKSIEDYKKIPERLLAHIQNDKSLKTQKAWVSENVEGTTREEKAAYAVAKSWGYNPSIHDGKLREILEEELNLCKRIQGEDIISIIAQGSSDKSKYSNLEKRLKSYIEKKLKPHMEKYIEVLEKLKDEEGRREEYFKQFQKWMKTGKPEDFPTPRGMTRSEELKQQDKKSLEQMKKYNKTEDKTGLELPMAEGLHDMTHKKPKKRSQYTKYTERRFLTDIGDDKSFEECIDPLGPFCIRLTAKSFMLYFDNQLKKIGIEEKFLVPELTTCSVEDSKVFHRYCTQHRKKC